MEFQVRLTQHNFKKDGYQKNVDKPEATFVTFTLTQTLIAVRVFTTVKLCHSFNFVRWARVFLFYIYATNNLFKKLL